MKVVIAQHKGGVGKTTLAVHVAATLSAGRFNKTLIVDCDSQGDSFRFFTSRFPEKTLELEEGMDNVDTLWNPERDKFSTKSSFSEYANLVVDVDTRVVNSLQIILEANPDIILIPVDKQQLSIVHGNQVVEMINEHAGHFAYPAKVIFIQMGCNWDLNPPSYKIPHSNDFDKCLNESDYIWNISNNLEFMVEIFRGLVNYAKQ